MLRVAALLALLMLVPEAAVAEPPQIQVPCAWHDRLVENLATKRGQHPAAFGLQSGTGNLIEVFASVDFATWTIVSVAPNGVSCILAVGENWENMRIVEEGSDT